MRYRLLSDYSVDNCLRIINKNTGSSSLNSINGFISKTYGDSFELTYVGNPTIVRYWPPTFKANLSFVNYKTLIEGEFTSGSRAFELCVAIWFIVIGGIGFLGALSDILFKTQFVHGGEPSALLFIYPVMLAFSILFPKHVEKLREKDRAETIKFLEGRLSAKVQNI